MRSFYSAYTEFAIYQQLPLNQWTKNNYHDGLQVNVLSIVEIGMRSRWMGADTVVFMTCKVEDHNTVETMTLTSGNI